MNPDCGHKKLKLHEGDVDMEDTSLIGVAVSEINNMETEIRSSSPMATMMTQEQIKMMEKALQNPLVLSKILKNLSYRQLKACRSVNKYWSSVSSKSLRQHSHINLSLDNHAENSNPHYPKKFRHYNRDKDSIKFTLVQLNKLLLQSSGSIEQFPCTSFSFLFFSFNEPAYVLELKPFVKFYGPALTNLELTNYCTTANGYYAMGPNSHIPTVTLVDLLRLVAPTLERLTLNNFLSNEWPTLNPSMGFPCLQVFTVVNVHSSFYTIVDSASDVKFVQNFNLQNDLNFFLASKKIQSVRKLVCMSHEQPEALAKFIEAGPNLCELEFRIFDPVSQDLGRLFHELLEVNRRFLQVLDLDQLASKTTSDFKIPVLSHLALLKLGGGNRWFPRGINLDQTFPNLWILDATQLGSTEFHQDNCRGKLLSVKIIKIEDCSEMWMTRIAEICPNFKKVVMHSHHFTLTRLIRLWPQVECLELKVKFGPGPNDPDWIPNWDSALTGFSEDTCDGLRQRGRHAGPPEEFEGLRVGPSIVDSKSLRKFRMIWTRPGQVRVVVILWTWVSLLYAFDLMPDLKVAVDIDYTISGEAVSFIESVMGPSMSLNYKEKETNDAESI